MNDNVTYVVNKFLRELGMKISIEYVAERLRSNPFHPSFRSISDFFREINVEHRVLRLSEEELVKVGLPFIAHTSSNGGYMYFIKEISKEKVTFSDPSRGTVTMPTEKFFKLWSGIALFATGENKEERKTHLKRYREEWLNNNILKLGLLFLLIVGISKLTFTLGNFHTFGEITFNNNLFNLLTKSAGLFFCYLLVLHEMKIPSSIVSRLCHINKSADCTSVTGSELATVYGNITLADIGFTYFGGFILSMILMPFDTLLPYIKLASLATIPIPFALVTYQLISVKKWCPLCMGVQVVIVLEFILSILTGGKLVFSAEAFLALSASMILTFLNLYFLKGLYKFRTMHLNERVAAQKLKRNPVLFDALLEKEDQILITGHPYNLIFGNSKSMVRLTAFLSLHCGGCARVFKQIKSILSNESVVSAHIILSSPATKDESKLLAKVYTSYSKGEKEKALKYLDEWYNRHSTENDEMEVEITGIIAEFTNEIIAYNLSLFEKNAIKMVPVVLINGHILPRGFSLEEIDYYYEYAVEKASSRNEVKHAEISNL